MFNIAGWPDTFSVSTEKLGLEGAWEVTDLWTGEKEGTIDRTLTAAVETHGVKLACLKKA